MLRALGSQLTRPDGSMTPEQLRDAADDYLRPYVLARLECPGEDLFSRILAVPIEGRPWAFDEAQRMCRNLLFGGLDTVVANVGFIALHLARYPEDWRRLREDPALIPAAADEFLRRYASTSVSRNVIADFEVDGVTLRTGDIVFLASTLHNLDPRSFDDPETVRFDRNSAPPGTPRWATGRTAASVRRWPAWRSSSSCANGSHGCPITGRTRTGP